MGVGINGMRLRERWSRRSARSAGDGRKEGGGSSRWFSTLGDETRELDLEERRICS